MPKATLFNGEVDKLILSTMVNFLSYGEFPGNIWALVAEKMGGDGAGYNADNVSQRFNKQLKQGEIIRVEDRGNVFLAGQALVQAKYDLGQIDSDEKEDSKKKGKKSQLGAYAREAFLKGDEILKGVSQFEDHKSVLKLKLPRNSAAAKKRTAAALSDASDGEKEKSPDSAESSKKLKRTKKPKAVRSSLFDEVEFSEMLTAGAESHNSGGAIEEGDDEGGEKAEDSRE